MHSKPLLRLVPLALLFVATCSPLLYTPAASDAGPNASLQDLQRGRELYTQKCGSCHALKLPENFTEEQWRVNVDRMQPRAGISNSEKALILSYVLTGSRRARSEVK